MVEVRSLTLHGLGQLEDGTLVERVLPGEDIELVDGAPRILTPSADRVAAPCRHFKTCGGCRMQHASDAFVAEWKTGIVQKAMQARGLPFPFRVLHTSPAQSRRRARFGVRKTKSGALIGFHGRASHVVVDAPDCQLVLPSLQAVRPALEALSRVASTRKSEVSITVTDSLNGVDVLVETDKPLDESLRINLTEIAGQHELARLVWGDEVIVTLAPPVQVFGSAKVAPPPGAFLQATRQGEAALSSAVVEAVGKSRRVVDLFAGCGTFSLPLAQTMDIHAVEGEGDLLAALDKGWRMADGLHRVSTERRDLFRRPLEPDELNRFDAAVIDPPRAGAEAQIATIAKSALGRVAMVSCNPVTFARDAETLIGAGFEIQWLDVVDQFRWSAHVELVALFTRS